METIKNVNLLDKMLDDLREYANKTNRIRCTPDIRDGLKTIHRRIIYATAKYEKAYNGKVVKSSTIVGSTMRSLHPHGDSSISGAMKPMINFFEIKRPILRDDGNWGSMQGSSAAAPRYTETGLTDFGYNIVYGDLKDTDKAVDWADNYDFTTKEPEYFPVKAPVLLINGTFGLGYGLKVWLPCHNFNDVIDATITLLHDKNAEITLIPDSCTPTEIIDTDWRRISKTGRGSYKTRGIVDITEYKGKPALVIRSVPDLTFADKVTEEIEKLVDGKVLPQITGMDDDSTEESLCIYLRLKPGTDPSYVRDMLYKNTQLEKTISVNMQVVCDNDPILIGYKDYLLDFIDRRIESKLRVYCNKLANLNTEYHRIIPFIKVLEDDEILDMIRKQKNTDDTYLIEYMIKKAKITDIQAKYILNNNIKKLSKGYLPKYKQKLKDLLVEVEQIRHLITHTDEILKEIEMELIEFKKQFGNQPRLTKIISKSEANNIPQGTFNLVITENGFVKKTLENEGIGRFSGDMPRIVRTVDNNDSVLFFLYDGRVCKIPVYKIPVSDPKSNGVDRSILNKNLISGICDIMLESTLKTIMDNSVDTFLVVLSEEGNIKKMDLQDFVNVPPSGILYIKLAGKDKVNSIAWSSDKNDIVVYTHNKALRMPMSEIPYLKRNTKGSKAISADTVDGMSIIDDYTQSIIIVTEKGKVNKFSVNGLPAGKRARAGAKVIKLVKGDNIKNIFSVSNQNEKLVLNVISPAKGNELMAIPVNELENGSSISPGKAMLTKSQTLISANVE